MPDGLKSSLQDEMLLFKARTEMPSGATIHDRNCALANYQGWLRCHALAEQGIKEPEKVEAFARAVRIAARALELLLAGIKYDDAWKQAKQEIK